MGDAEDEQALNEAGDILQMMKLPGCEEADNVNIRQWILADDCDVGHQMHIDNDIVPCIVGEKWYI
jgi:hypothetical protein